MSIIAQKRSAPSCQLLAGFFHLHDFFIVFVMSELMLSFGTLCKLEYSKSILDAHL